MALFEDVLLTVDFDRTFTGPDSRIPQRNLEAVRFFMDNGGHFTVNTGRSLNTFRKHLSTIPVNAPVLMYNGSAWYENGQLVHLKTIDLDLWDTIDIVRREFPQFNLEVQAVDTHYLIETQPEYVAFYKKLGWGHDFAQHGQDLGPFLKFALAGSPTNGSTTVATLFNSSAQEQAAFDAAQARIEELFGDKVVVFRAAPRIIDVHAKGVSKIHAARELQRQLGKKILVCVGDAENDLSMLEGADYAFCPADAVVADRFCNVCNCAEGAVADVILKKIPEILGFHLDNQK